MKNLKKYLILILILISFTAINAQEGYKEIHAPDSVLNFKNKNFHETVKIDNTFFKTGQKPKNVILFIGDGMGLAQIFGAQTANKGMLNITNLPVSGFSMTQSANKYITDSGAGGTALACGQKTDNGMIGISPDQKPIKSITEMSETAGLSTGIVVTCALTHATPASFAAHQVSRKMYEEIAADFLKTDIDVMIGGGLNHFTKRKDKRNLVEELKNKKYSILYNINEIENSKADKIAAFLDTVHLDRAEKRNDMLQKSVSKAIEILAKNKSGFFMMVEGSQIDWGGHQNDTHYVINELLDMDKAVGEALKFAITDKNTLIIITADHETGGMTLNGGNISAGESNARYTSDNHTAVPVPVFAFGPGAENFTGMYQNTDIFKKIVMLLNLK